MVDPIFQSDNTYQLARKMLDASVLRQNAIASNIANAETPGYRRVEVNTDFATQLRAKLESGTKDFAADTADIKPSLVEDRHSRSVRPDGNNVEIEREMLDMNKNTVEYDYLTEVVSRNLKQLKLAITGRA
ncbi:MAG TPA: flagellar basal body rod protein FlgB [Opitutaceae bacterium]|nr:flagellar basal body rod protein FlgB [Opitutaceae bacterium]